ncbi:MAG: GDP-mannose 4,6-dehydratase [Acidobacteriota bacterium]
MRVLVTGAAGFVGQRLLARLQEAGDEVYGLRMTSEELAGNLAGQLVGDVEDLEWLRGALHDVRPHAVIHLAALSDVAASWKHLDRYFSVNVLGTENLLEAVPETTRVVVASSAEVYGKVRPEELPVAEDRPLRPTTPYALTKAAAERLAVRHRAIVVRSFNLVGPGQDARFALPSFAEQLRGIKNGDAAPVLKVGNLSAARDFVHVDDAADAYRLLAEKGEPGHCYNLASGTAVVLRDALDRLIATAGVDVSLVQDPERLRPSDVPVIAGDASALRELGWQPRRGLDQAIRDLWLSLDDSE